MLPGEPFSPFCLQLLNRFLFLVRTFFLSSLLQIPVIIHILLTHRLVLRTPKAEESYSAFNPFHK